MSNATRFLIGWLLAAAIAVALSWGAVAQVRNRVIQPSVVIPTTQLAATPETTATSPTATTTTASPRVVRVDPEPVESVAPTTEAPTITTTTGPPPTGSQPVSTTTTTTTTTSTTLPPTTTTTATTTTMPPAQTSSYSLVGGVVTISYSPGVVNFVSAIPQPGYSTEQRETGPTEVRIRFESDDHTSDFRARWQDGELEITENETGDDD